jgi:hypothetical protein
MSEHKQNLTDLAAMFAMMGLLARGETHVAKITYDAYDLAEELMIVRDERIRHDDIDDDEGIAAIKPKRTRRSEK